MFDTVTTADSIANTITLTTSYPTTTNTTTLNYPFTTSIDPFTVSNKPSKPYRLEAGEIVLKGEDLSKRIERIEKVLQMPTRDVTMEQKYADLKALADQYSTMLDSLRTWDTLQSK